MAEPQHVAVLQPDGLVIGLLAQRGGKAAVPALAQLEGLLDFLPLQVVFHGAGLRLVVEEHVAGRVDVADAQPLA